MGNNQENQQKPEEGTGEVVGGEQQTQTQIQGQVISQPVEQSHYREVYRIIPPEQNTNQFKEVSHSEKVVQYIPKNQESQIEQQQVHYVSEVKQYPTEAGAVSSQYYSEFNTYQEPRDSKRKNRFEGEYYTTNYNTQGEVRYRAGSVESIPNHLSFEVIESNPQVVENVNKRMVQVIETEGEYGQMGSGIMSGSYTIGGGGINAGLYKFEGERIELREEAPKQEILIEEEEINKEILKRTNNVHKGKRRYELVDKYYAVTEVDPKALRKRIREEEKQGGTSAYNYYAAVKVSQGARATSASKGTSAAYIYSYINSLRNKNSSSLPADNFCRYLLDLINKIRANPRSFIPDIQNAKANIVRDKHGNIIYKSKLRVALAEGEIVFDEAINFLNSCPPMEPLIFSPTITVEPPRNLFELKDRTDMRKKVELMVNNGIPIRAFWRDIIKDPRISFLLMIIDDTGTKRGLRRQDILDPDMRYIGISSTEINGNFVCYLTFSPIL